MSNFISTKVFAKISELDEAIQFDSADEFVVVNDNVTQKITGLNLTESIVSIGNLASKAYVDAVVDGAPELLDTLNELAAALDDDANFATTITALIGTKLASSDFNSYFDTALTGKTTSDVAEDANLYYTQARFDSALAAKTTADVAEGTNLYFTEQRVLDIIAEQPTNRLANGSLEVILNASGTLTLPAEPTSDSHAATKGYVDNQVDIVVAGQGFATLGYVEDAIGDALDNYKSDRLVNGSKEVVLQSNGYIRLVNGAQLYDYGSGAGNGYGITDAANSTYIGYDPSDTLGALHMDSYTGGNIRIRTTTLPNTYKDWLFESNGSLTLPAEPTSANHAATKGYVDNAIANAFIVGTSVDFGGGTSDLGNGSGSSGGSSGGANSSGAISVVKVEKVNDEYVFTTLSGDVSGDYDAELNTAFFTLNGFTSLPSNVFVYNHNPYGGVNDLFNSSYGISIAESENVNPLTNFDPTIHKIEEHEFREHTNGYPTWFYSFQSNGGSGSGGVTSYNDLTDKPTLFQIGIKEPISAQTSASGVVDHDMATANIFNHSNLAGNFTCNVTNLSLPTNNAINVTLIVNQGATPYMPTAFQIGGVAQTINWLNGIAPAGSASKIDVASFSILNNSGTYTVLGSLSTFG